MKFFDKLMVGKKIAVGYSIMVAAILIASIIALLSLLSLTREFSFIVEHDQRVLSNATRLEKLIIDMETGERGYLITGKKEFLEPYNTGQAKFKMLIEEQMELVSDNPAQVKRLEEINQLKVHWLQKAAIPEIDARREVDANRLEMKDVAEMIESGVGKSILDNLRAKFAAFTEVEIKLNTQRNKHVQNTAKITQILIGFMMIASITISIIVGLALTRAIAGNLTILTKAAIEVADGELDYKVEIMSQDEIGILAKTFNQMTQRLREMFETSKKQRLEAENLRDKSNKLVVKAEEQAQRVKTQKDQLAKEVSERQKSEDKFRMLIESSPDGIIMINRTGDIVLINRQIKKLFGYSSEELVGRKIELLIPHRFAAKHPECRGLFFKHPRIRPMGQGLDLWGLCKDGRKFALEIALSPVETDEGIAVIASVRDITERKRSEEKIKKSEASLYQAQRIAHLGNWELNITENTLYWSDEVYRIFGLKPREVEATYEAFLDHIHPDDRERVNKAYTNSLKYQRPYEIIHRLKIADGTIKHVNEKCETYYDNNGAPVLSVGTVQDITKQVGIDKELARHRERKEKDKQLRRNMEELEQFSKMAVGREKDMIKLKEEINGLRKELGKESKYEIVS